MKFLTQLYHKFLAWRAQRLAAKIIARVKAQYPHCEGAMNAWPPVSGSTPGYTAQGTTTVQWGTDGLLKTPHPASGFYVVTRFGQKTLVDNIKLPNGSGVTSTRVQILDGQEWTLTVRDDSAMTPPKVSTTVNVVDAGGILGTVGLAYTATVTDANYEAAPKQAGERVLVVENLILIESQTGS